MVELDDRIVKGKKDVMEMILEACESGKILKVKADYGNETPVPPGQNHSFTVRKPVARGTKDHGSAITKNCLPGSDADTRNKEGGFRQNYGKGKEFDK